MGANASGSRGSELAHPCPWQGCTKAYRRLDHLERHKKSHSGDLNYRCHVCHRQYSRSDVLNRHLVLTHGKEPTRPGRPRRAACVACVEKSVACDGVPPKTCGPCHARGRVCRYRHLEMEAQQHSEGTSLTSDQATASGAPATHPMQSSPPQQPLSPPRGDTVSYGVGLAALGDAAESVIQGDGSHNVETSPLLSTHGMWHESPTDMFGAPADTDEAPAPWLTELILNATMNPNISAMGAYAMPDGTESAFGWGFPELGADLFAPLAADPSTADQVREDDLRVAVFPEEVDGRPNHPQPIPDGQPSESVWPNVYRPSTPEPSFLIPAPPASASDAGPFGPSIKPSARAMMETLTLHAHRAFWATPDLGNFPSGMTLTTCVHLYLHHFAGWLPIIDSPRGNFLIDKSAPLLLKAMAAIGSVYARDGTERLGMPLMELVRRDLLFIVSFFLYVVKLILQCEHDQRFQYDVGVVQSSLLQGYFGLFSGSPKLGQHAEVARAGAVAAAKRMHLLKADVSAVAHVKRCGADDDAFELERALKQDHRRRRLGWAIFLFDCQLAGLFGQRALFPLTEIDSPLPSVAPTAEPQPSFTQVMAELLESGTMPSQHLDDIALSCIAHALYRTCLDAAALQVFGQIRAPGAKYTLPVPGYTYHPQALLDQLAARTLRFSAPTHLVVSCAALAYHAHLQFTELGFLEQVKVAAGRGGPAAAANAHASLARWMRDNPQAARNVLAHAALLFSLVSRFVFDTPPELVWLFDAALCMWAVLTHATFVDGPLALTLAWTPNPALDRWIETGDGALAVQGLGRIPGLAPDNVLRVAADRLDVVSWGLAAKYRRVLLGLVSAERRSEEMGQRRGSAT